MRFIANPVEAGTASVCGVCALFYAVFMCGRIKKMESHTIIILGISRFIFIYGRRLEIFAERWWLWAATLFRVGVAIVVLLFFYVESSLKT